MNELTDAKIAELKAEHGDRLIATTITLPDELLGEQITIVWKPPTHGVWSLFIRTVEKDGGVKANRLLMLAVAVYPDRHALIQFCMDAPMAVRDFLDEAGVTRFFGGEATISENRTL